MRNLIDMDLKYTTKDSLAKLDKDELIGVIHFFMHSVIDEAKNFEWCGVEAMDQGRYELEDRLRAKAWGMHNSAQVMEQIVAVKLDSKGAI